MSPKFDLSGATGETVRPEYFEHPEVGWLSYDPNTLAINPHRSGKRPIGNPIKMVGKFFGTKQPYTPSCSEPGNGNMGCQKWYGCPMKKYPHVGPSSVIMRKTGTVSHVHCYDFFESTRGGKPISQVHYGTNGWALDTTRTTIDVLGRTHAIESGALDDNSSREKIIGTRPKVWQMEITDLLPPWWPLLKKKGIPLPPSAEHYPELAEDEEEPSGKENAGRDAGENRGTRRKGGRVRRHAQSDR